MLGVLRLPVLDGLLDELETLEAAAFTADVVGALERLAELLTREMLGASPETVPRRARIVELIRRADDGRLPALAADEGDAFGVELRAMTYGGIITNLKVPDRSGHVADIVLGGPLVAAIEPGDFLDRLDRQPPHARRPRPAAGGAMARWAQVVGGDRVVVVTADRMLQARVGGVSRLVNFLNLLLREDLSSDSQVLGLNPWNQEGIGP